MDEAGFNALADAELGRLVKGNVINPNETLRKIRDQAEFDGTGRDGS